MQDATDIHEVLAHQTENDDMPWAADLAFRGSRTRPAQHERIDDYAGSKVRPTTYTGPFGIFADIAKSGAYERIVSLACGNAE